MFTTSQSVQILFVSMHLQTIYRFLLSLSLPNATSLLKPSTAKENSMCNCADMEKHGRHQAIFFCKLLISLN